MSRPPWRLQDIGDSIRGVSTRPSLPSGVLIPLGDTEGPGALDLTGVDEVYCVMLEGNLVIWPMKLGKPWVV